MWLQGIRHGARMVKGRLLSLGWRQNSPTLARGFHNLPAGNKRVSLETGFLWTPRSGFNMSTSHPTSSILLHAYYVLECRETLYKHLAQTGMVAVLVATLQLKLGAFSSLLALLSKCP